MLLNQSLKYTHLKLNNLLLKRFTDKSSPVQVIEKTRVKLESTSVNLSASLGPVHTILLNLMAPYSLQKFLCFVYLSVHENPHIYRGSVSEPRADM